MKKLIYIAISILGIGAFLSGCQALDKKRDLTWMYGCWQGDLSTITLSRDSLYRKPFKAGDDIRLRLYGKDALRFDSKDIYSIQGDFICVNDKPLYFINDSTKTLSECEYSPIHRIASIRNDDDSWIQGYYFESHHEVNGIDRDSPIIKITDKIELSDQVFDAFSVMFMNPFKEDDVVDLSYKASPESTIEGNCLRIESYDDMCFWINDEKRVIERITSDYMHQLRKYDEDKIKAEDEALSAMDNSWISGMWEGIYTEYENDILCVFDVSPTEYTQIFYRNTFSKSYEILGPYLVPRDALTDGRIDDSYFEDFYYSEDFDGYYFDLMIDPLNRKIFYHGIPMTKKPYSRAQEVFRIHEKKQNEGFAFISSDDSERYIFYPANKMAVYCKMTSRSTAPQTLWEYQVSGDGIISNKNGIFVNDYHDAEKLNIKLEQRGDGISNVFFTKDGNEFHAVYFREDTYLSELFNLVLPYFDGSKAPNTGMIYADEVDPNTNDAAIQGRIQRETIQKMRELNYTSDPSERQRINNEINQLHRQSNESTMENLRRGR